MFSQSRKGLNRQFTIRFLRFSIVFVAMLVAVYLFAMQLQAGAVSNADLRVVVIPFFGDDEIATEKLTQQTVARLQETLSNNGISDIGIVTAASTKGRSLHDWSGTETRHIADQFGAQFVITGDISDELGQSRVRITLTNYLLKDRATTIRPQQIKTFFLEDVGATFHSDSSLNDNEEHFAHFVDTYIDIVLGLRAYSEGRYEQAKDDIQLALSCLDARSDAAKPKDAAEGCDQVTISSVEPGALYYYLGKSLALEGNYEQAIHYLELAATHQPYEPASWISIGEVYQTWSGDSESPLAGYAFDIARQKVDRLMVTMATTEAAGDIEYDLGIIAELQDDSTQAMNHYAEAISLLEHIEQSTFGPLMGLARATGSLGDIRGAEALYLQAETLAPASPWPKLGLAVVYRDNRTQAELLLTRAAEVAPDEAYVDIQRAALCAYWSDHACADDAYKNALAKRPESGWIRSMAGNYYVPSEPISAHHSWDVAEGYYRVVAEKDRPQDPWAHERLGYTLAQQGEYDQALVHYERTIELARPEAIPNRLYCTVDELLERTGAEPFSSPYSQRCVVPLTHGQQAASTDSK